METTTTIRPPDPFIDYVAKEDWTLSQVLAPLDVSRRGEYLRDLYLTAYREGRDEQAAKIFSTICVFITGRTAPEGVATVGPAEYLGRIGMSYWELLPINGAMGRTHTAHLEAVISGLGAGVEDDESAKVCMRFLVDVYNGYPGMRAVILGGVRKATDKNTKFTRVVALLSAGPQEELLRTVVNALVRNSDDASLKRTAELATLLEGCSDGIYDFVKKEIERLKEVGSKIASIHVDITNVLSMDLKVSYDPGRAMLVASGYAKRTCNEQNARAIQAELLSILDRWSDKIMPGREVAVDLDVRIDTFNGSEWYRITADRVMRLGKHIK